MIKHAPFGLMVFDADGRLIQFNDEAARLTGYDAHDLPTFDSWLDRASPDPDGVRRAELPENSSWSVLPIQCASGEVKELEFRLQSLGDLRLITLLGGADRKGILTALRKSEEKYRAVFETTGTAMMIIEEDYRLTLVNAEFEILSGWRREELSADATWTQFFAEDDLERMITYHHQRRVDPLSAPRRYECKFIDRSGVTKNVLIRVDMIPDTRTSVASMLDITAWKRAEAELTESREELELRVQKRTTELSRTNEKLSQEITERRRSQEALAESEEKYRFLVQQSSDGIFILNPRSGDILEANLQFFSMLGYDQADIEQLSIYDLVVGEREVIDAHIAQTCDSGTPVSGQRRYRCKDGAVIDVEITAALVRYRTEEVVMVNVRDIRERKKAEAEREKLIAELQEALRKVKKLRGLLPICASCKKVRDYKGYWNQIEEYISEHADVDFSHGLCPECTERLYPERLRKRQPPKP